MNTTWMFGVALLCCVACVACFSQQVGMRRMGPRGMWNGIGWGCPRHRPRPNAFWSNAVATVNAVNMANAIAWKVGWGTRAKH